MNFKTTQKVCRHKFIGYVHNRQAEPGKQTEEIRMIRRVLADTSNHPRHMLTINRSSMVLLNTDSTVLSLPMKRVRQYFQASLADLSGRKNGSQDSRAIHNLSYISV